jgi:type II secretory pathway pseudopilin PulG
MPRWKVGRRAQAGTTLIELLVSLMIVGLALVLIVGTFSTGLLDATMAKRNTAVEAVIQYELDNISGSTFNPSIDPTLQSYSECFATESSTTPFRLSSFQAPCPNDQPYTLRADVLFTPQQSPTRRQLWTITVIPWSSASPSPLPIGSPVSTYKVNR